MTRGKRLSKEQWDECAFIMDVLNRNLADMSFDPLSKEKVSKWLREMSYHCEGKAKGIYVKRP